MMVLIHVLPKTGTPATILCYSREPLQYQETTCSVLKGDNLQLLSVPHSYFYIFVVFVHIMTFVHGYLLCKGDPNAINYVHTDPNDHHATS